MMITKSIEASDQQSHLLEKSMPIEPYATHATSGLPGKLVGRVNSRGNTVLDRRNDGITTASGKDINDKMLIGDGPDHEDLKNSSPLEISSSGDSNGYRSMSGSGDILIENEETAEGDLDIGDTSSTLVLRKTVDNIRHEANQNSTPKFLLSTQTSDSMVDKLLQRNVSSARQFRSQISKKKRKSPTCASTSSMSYVGLPRGAQNPFGGQNAFGRSDDEHAGKDLWPPGPYRDGSKTEELKAARAGSSTNSPVFHHPNGAGSKTEEQKTAFADMSILHFPLATGPIGECKYCLTVGKHYTAACPYRECVPKGATVSSFCEILCTNCSGLFTENCCGLDGGRAILKECVNCGPVSDHWTPMCPLKNGVHKNSIPISMDLAPEKSNFAPAGHLIASYSPACHCVIVQFSNDEHGGKDLGLPGAQY